MECSCQNATKPNSVTPDLSTRVDLKNTPAHNICNLERTVIASRGLDIRTGDVVDLDRVDEGVIWGQADRR